MASGSRIIIAITAWGVLLGLALWFHAPLMQWGMLDQALVTNGEWHRWISGHLVHFTPTHLLLNAGGTALLWWLYLRDLSLHAWLSLTLGLALWISLGLGWVAPELQRYAGFSGVLHGLLAFALLRATLNGPERGLQGTLLGALVAKLLYEQTPWYDPNAQQALIGVPVATTAHWLGALGGAIVALSGTGLAALRLRPGSRHPPSTGDGD